MKNKDFIIEVDAAFGDVDVNDARYISTKQRNKLKDSDYIDHERRSFPIKTCEDIHAAIHAWGRYKGKLTFDQFKARIKRKAKEMGCTIPDSWKNNSKSN